MTDADELRALRRLEKRLRTAKERKEQKDAAPPRPPEPPPGPPLGPLFVALGKLQREPREPLEARYAAWLGAPTPPEARHAWLVAACAYALQAAFYLTTPGGEPARVRARRLAQLREPRGPRDGRAFDAGDPPRETWWHDPALRVVAARPENPFARGAAWTRFQVLLEAGAAGRTHAELATLYERLLDLAVPAAQALAGDAFTAEVRADRATILVPAELGNFSLGPDV